METARILIYDGSFNGFLTSIYRAFEEGERIINMQPYSVGQNGLFSETETIVTEIDKAKRVWNAIQAKSNVAIKNIYFSFLSGSKGIEILLYKYICKMFFPTLTSDMGLTDDMVHRINNLAKSVAREKQRLETFIHLEMSPDGIYYAYVNPEFDVLPLISKHFRSRYSDQPWIIYDTKRKYGLSFDLLSIAIISTDPRDILAKNVFALETVNDEISGYQDPSIDYAINSSDHGDTQLPYSQRPYSNYLSERKAV